MDWNWIELGYQNRKKSSFSFIVLLLITWWSNLFWRRDTTLNRRTKSHLKVKTYNFILLKNLKPLLLMKHPNVRPSSWITNLFHILDPVSAGPHLDRIYILWALKLRVVGGWGVLCQSWVQRKNQAPGVRKTPFIAYDKDRWNSLIVIDNGCFRWKCARKWHSATTIA